MIHKKSNEKFFHANIMQMCSNDIRTTFMKTIFHMIRAMKYLCQIHLKTFKIHMKCCMVFV